MRFILSLGEQGMGSIVTFGINLWLIRNGEASSYGVYVFWYAVAWVLGTCQGTLTIVHLFALPAGSDRLAERRDPERILLSATTVLLLLAALGVAITNRVLVHIGSTLAEPAAILFIPAFLLFQYVRAFAFSRQRVLLATCLTGGILVTCSCSHHVSESMLFEIVAQAALDAGKTLRVLERRTQAADHPILLTVPETLYLKCQILEVLGR